MNLIQGKKIAQEILAEIKDKVAEIAPRKPSLAFILVGDNAASQTYVQAKKKACTQIGITSTLIELPANTSQKELIDQIHALNCDPLIDGILIQLPLPLHISDQAIMLAIDPKKDVDGFHPLNMGKLLLGDDSGFLPCTPSGIKELLKRQQIQLSGKHVVILGRSNIVGKPLAAMLMQKKEHCNATVTIAHSSTENLKDITLSADILIAAIGKPRFIRKEMAREGCVIIDVGINRLSNGTLVGDVDFENVAPKTSWITPVPGGVGPMTIAMLMKNTLLAYEKNNLL